MFDLLGKSVSFWQYDPDLNHKVIVAGKVTKADGEGNFQLGGYSKWYFYGLCEEFVVAPDVDHSKEWFKYHGGFLLAEIVSVLKKQISNKKVRRETYEQLIAIFENYGGDTMTAHDLDEEYDKVFSSIYAADPHLGCYSYPNCDISSNGCCVIHGKDAEPYGHRD